MRQSVCVHQQVVAVEEPAKVMPMMVTVIVAVVVEESLNRQNHLNHLNRQKYQNH
jgi:hypothetical protein